MTITTPFYQHPDKFLVSVDCIILGFSNKELKVLLTTRKLEPHIGGWSLMGGFVNATESVNEAAMRVLTQCTGIDNIYMEQVGAYGDLNRDSGDRVISVAYYALVNTDLFCTAALEKHDSVWISLEKLPDLIFDHNLMIRDTLNILRRKTATSPISFNLLQNKFTLPQLQSLFEAIYQQPLDKRNFRKKLLAMNILDKLDEKDKKSSKRGAYYYIFNEEKYNIMKEEDFCFYI